MAALRLPLNDDRSGVLYGNHIYIVMLYKYLINYNLLKVI
jgi:hypothetical protein